MQLLVWLFGFFVFLGTVGPVTAQPPKAFRIGGSGAWAVYDYDLGDRTVCFAASRPRTMTPRDSERRPVRVFVSTWPDIEPGNPPHEEELSFLIGADVTSANVKVDGVPFTLFGEGSGAFVLERTQEQKIVAAMRKGKSLSITSALKDGTVSTDVYSLNGVTAALKSLGDHCGARRSKGKRLEARCFDAWEKIRTPEARKAKLLMARGPAYAKANYTKEQIAQIGDYYNTAETIKFRCSNYTPPPRVNPKRQ